jgi:hypothetical protein
MEKHSHPLKDAVGRMSTQAIFKNSKELNRNAGKDGWIKAYNQAATMLKTDKVRGMRHGNTLFIYKLGEPHTAQMFIVNADSPKHFFKNLEQFVLAMQQAGFTTVFGFTDDLSTIKIIQKLGLKHGYKTAIENTGAHEVRHQTYRVTVNV